MRVLVHDGDVVMYDAWWPDLGDWGLADLGSIKRRRVSYYVVATRVLAEKAAYLRAAPLTAHELSVHRPDLPFAALQEPGLSWTTEPPSATTPPPGPGEVDGDGARVALHVGEIYLCPFGPQGGSKAGTRVKAANGQAFTVAELLRIAATVQASQAGDLPPVQGVGVYREGLQRGLPAYYLWGAESRLHDSHPVRGAES